MHHAFRPVILLSALAMLPLLAVAQNAPPEKVDVAKVRAKLLAGTYIEGKLYNINVDEVTFTFRHLHQVKKSSPKDKAKLDEFMNRWNLALKMRSTSLEALEKMQKEGRALYKATYQIEETPIDFELQGDKKTPIRNDNLPLGPDGKPVMTAAEIKKVKGDPRLPGITANIKSLNSKQYVRVYIDKKGKPVTKENEPTVYPLSMIVIVPESRDNDPFVIPGS